MLEEDEKDCMSKKIWLKKEYNRPMANTKLEVKEEEAYEKLLKYAWKKIKEDEQSYFLRWKLDLDYDKIIT